MVLESQTESATLNSSVRKKILLAALPLIASLCGCHNLPPSKPLSELTPQEMDGYHVFQARCAECHRANSQRALHGPGLQGLYRLPYLPSGLPANDDRVLATIQHGRNTMPALGDRLDSEETSNLLAYLHTL